MIRRAVVFDLFGTLTPCYPLDGVARTIAAMADDLDVPREAFTAAWNRTFPHRQRDQFKSLGENVTLVLTELGFERSDPNVAAACERRIAFERTTIIPRPDVLPTLRALRSAGVRTALISNCSQETPTVWPQGPLSGVLDAEVFSCLVPWAKPDERIYRHACREIRTDPADCLFVGDGSADELRGAEAAGMTAALIRAEDDDESHPGRLDRASWTGPLLRAIAETVDLVGIARTVGG